MRKSHHLRRGFTLIELMVVIVILGLLAGIVAPNVQRHLVDGRIATAKQQMANIDGAIQGFRMANRRLPDSLSELVGEDGFLQGAEVPKDPWGNDYVFDKIDKKRYDLICYGGDGVEGGEDREDQDIHLADLTKQDTGDK